MTPNPSLRRRHSVYQICCSLLMTWTARFFSRRLEAEVLSLPAGLVARFLRFAERMEIYGPDLGMPHTRAMGQGLFDLRPKAAEGIARRRMKELKNG
jgi:Phage derived protein Gp49-like (DUF891)